MAVIDEIAAERKRQIEVEGWIAEHDDAHRTDDMALAAACYAMPFNFSVPDPRSRRGSATISVSLLSAWPWDRRWLKLTTRRRDLIKAAALIVAEIEKLDRAEAPKCA